MERLFLKYS